MSYCLLILNCKKYDFKRQRQLSTWLKSPPVDLWFHVHGDPALKTEYVFDLSEHILTVNTPDDYVSLCKKVYMAIKAVHEYFPEITHILKTDDDMNFDTCNFNKINKVIRFYDYGGCFVDMKNDTLSTYHYHDSIEKKPAICRKCKYACGRFYFISTKSMNHIIKYRDIFWDSMFEDNTVGYVLQSLDDKKVLPFPDKLLFTEFPDYETH